MRSKISNIVFIFLLCIIYGCELSSEKQEDSLDSFVLDDNANITGTWDLYIDFSGGEPVVFMGKLIFVQKADLVSVIYGLNGLSAGGSVSGNILTLALTGEDFTGTLSGTVDASNKEITGSITCTGKDCSFTNASIRMEKYSDSTDIPVTDLPIAGVTVDGNISDWASTDIFIQDQVKEPGMDTAGSDIDYVKASVNKSKTRLNILIKTAQGSADPGIKYVLKFTDYNANYKICMEIQFENGWMIQGYDGITDVPINISGIVSVSGEYIECGMMLGAFYFPPEFEMSINTGSREGGHDMDNARLFGYAVRPSDITAFIAGTWDVFIGLENKPAKNHQGKIIFTQNERTLTVPYGLDIDEKAEGSVYGNKFTMEVKTENEGVVVKVLSLSGVISGNEITGSYKECIGLNCQDGTSAGTFIIVRYSDSIIAPEDEIRTTDDIIVDGNADDWASIETCMPDQIGENTGILNGSDIEYVKLATNNERSRLYVLMKTASTSIEGIVNPNVVYQVKFKYGGGRIRFNKVIYARSDRKWMLYGYDLISGSELSLNSQLGIGQGFVEFRVDLNAMNFPDIFQAEAQTYGKNGCDYDSVKKYGYSYVTDVLADNINWRFHADKFVYYSSPAVDSSGIIYFATGRYMGTQSGTLYAVYPDGILKWKYDLDNNGFSPVIAADGTVNIQDDKCVLYSFSSTGALKWKHSVNQHWEEVGHRTPVIGDDGTIYIANAYLEAINPDGSVKWTSNACGIISASPVMAADGSILAIRGWGTETLYKIDPVDGSEIWHFRIEQPDEHCNIYSSPAVDADGVIYFGSELDYPDNKAGGFLYAVNQDGTLKWRYYVRYCKLRSSPAIGSDGTIYIGTKANWESGLSRLLAIFPDGTLKWEYTIPHIHETADDIYCSPAIGANGVIYFGAETGFLYAMNTNGSLRWQIPTGGTNWSSAAILQNGTLYIGTSGNSDTGFLYSVRTDSRGLADSPWPKFHKNNRNTGRYDDSE